MRELGVDLVEVRTFFSEAQSVPFVLVKVPPERVARWAEMLGVPARRCYISDVRLKRIIEERNHPHALVVGAVLPDAGSVMAGDFGEIMAALYLAAAAYPEDVLEPKMWRLKSRRTAASEGSDVVQFQLPHWPASSPQDKIVCAEVKTKSTNGKSTPVESAIADSHKDRQSRLAKTLLWLKERAILDDLGTVQIPHIERFINAIDHPPAVREFYAVAVISAELVENELSGVAPPGEDQCELVVISVPDLKATYETLYKTVLESSTAQVGMP